MCVCVCVCVCVWRVGTPHCDTVGFFVVDYDTTAERMVFNRIVALKESKEKDK